jgi:microcystin-dependent protein
MADNSKFIQTQTFKLAGGGISLSDTSISLQSFKFPDGNVITMSHIGALGTGTLEPGASKEEIISFTGVTQNGDGSATLTGVTRGLKFGDTAGDYGQNLALRKSHAGNTSFVITNNPQFYNKFAAKDNDEVITGDWQVPTPANGGSIANKDYVNAAVSGSVSTATTSTAGTTRTSKDQSAKAKSKAVQAREQDTPDKTLKIESFRLASIDRIVNYTGGNTPNFIDPGFGGDLAITANPSNTETFVITIDGTAVTFTAVSSIGSTPGNFLIAGSAAATRANLAALINNPTVTNANQVAFTGAQLTAIQKMGCTDDLSANIFIRATNPAVVSVSAVENFAGAGNTWTANTTKNRIDLVVLNSSDTLAIRSGSEAVSPTAPTPTTGDIVICSVFNRPGMTAVRDYDLAGQSYISDWYDLSVYRTDLQGTPTGTITMFGGSSAPSGWLLCDGTAVSRTTYASLFAVTSTTYGTGDGSTTFNLPDLRSRTAIGAGTGTKIATFSSRASNVITVTGLTNANNNEFQTGVLVRYSTSGSVITGLINNTDYYVVRVSNTTFSLATTRANAVAGTVITLTSDGSGTQTFTVTLTARSAGNTGGEENHSLTTTELPSHLHGENYTNGAGNGLPAYTGSNAGQTGISSTPNTGNNGRLNTDNTGGDAAHNIMSPFVVVNYIIKI